MLSSSADNGVTPEGQILRGLSTNLHPQSISPR
jgi:hypothetical protein